MLNTIGVVIQERLEQVKENKFYLQELQVLIDSKKCQRYYKHIYDEVELDRGNPQNSYLMWIWGKVDHIDTSAPCKITKGRVSLPDVDCDFESAAREDIIQYLKDKYGHDRVAQIITFGRMQGRSVLKDVLRAYSACSFEEMNQITEFIPDEAAISDKLQEMRDADKAQGGSGEVSIIEWSLENHAEELKPWCSVLPDGTLTGPLATKFAAAIRLEGTVRSSGKHAAGVIIASEPLESLVPMVYDSKTGTQIVGFDYETAESVGLVKLDILSVAVLDKLHGIQNLLGTGTL